MPASEACVEEWLWWESGRGQAASKLAGRVSGTPSLTTRHLAAPAANAARRSRDFGNAAMLIFPATLHRRQFRRLLLSLPLRAHTRALPTPESQSPPHEVFYCAS